MLPELGKMFTSEAEVFQSDLIPSMKSLGNLWNCWVCAEKTLQAGGGLGFFLGFGGFFFLVIHIFELVRDTLHDSTSVACCCAEAILTIYTRSWIF